MSALRSAVGPPPTRISSAGSRRLAWTVLLTAAATLAVIQLLLQASGGKYGYDFRGGVWDAGRSLLDGRSPFPSADAHQLLLHPNGFINPPPLAVLGALLAWMPFGVAVVAFNIACGVGLWSALRVAGVRDRAVIVLALCAFPFVSSLALGQPDGLLALLAAVAWRDRDRSRGAVAAGVLIAAKLLAWPLLLWLLSTRRVRSAAVAVSSAVGTLALSWALLGFRGLTAYPRLLIADAHAFEGRAHSFFTLLARSGLAAGPASVLTVVLALALSLGVWRAAGGSDLGIFTAALTLGIWASPVVWQHYLVLLFIPLAATRRGRDPIVWLLVLGLWLSPSETPATLAQAWLIPLLAAGICARIGWLARSAEAAGPAGAPTLA